MAGRTDEGNGSVGSLRRLRSFEDTCCRSKPGPSLVRVTRRNINAPNLADQGVRAIAIYRQLSRLALLSEAILEALSGPHGPKMQ